jgi:Tol biopolymer transport system component
MPLPQSCIRLSTAFFVLALCSTAQEIVYSGREYLKVGRSWSQIRELNLTTNQRRQLAVSPRDHWHPWCAPDGKSVFFTSSSENGKEILYRFDRFTKQENASVVLDQEAVSDNRSY